MREHRTYTVQEKVKICTQCQKHGWRATAKKYGIPYGTTVAWRNRIKKGGAPLAVLLARKPKRHTVCDEVVALVKKLHAEQPNLPLEALRKKVSHVQHISRTTVWHIVTGR